MSHSSLTGVFCKALWAFLAALALVASMPAHAAISFEGYVPQTFDSNAVSSLSFNAPANTQAGDLMLVQLVINGGTGVSITEVPAGWGVAANRVDNGTALMQIVYYRIAPSSGSTLYTWKFNSNRAAGSLIVFRGVDATNPINAAGGQSNAPASNAITAPSITTTVAGTTLVGFFSTADGNTSVTVPCTPLPCMSPGSQGQTGAGPNGVAFRNSYAPLAAAGPSGTRRATGGAAALNIGQLVALTPASVGATAPGGFNGFESTTPANAISGRIFTKLAGVPFTLDIVALNDASSAVLTTFAGEVKVELLNASNNAGALDANKCRPDWTAIPGMVANPVFGASDNGRKSVSFTVNDALREVRVRVSYPATGTPTSVGCSTDNFTIRPAAFSEVTSNMSNAGASGTPKARAGADSFTLEAHTGLTHYDGTPKIAAVAVQAHATAARTGALAGVFSAADNGTASGVNAFTYSEVGKFRLLGSVPSTGDNVPRGVYDDSFTLVDQPAPDNPSGDCTNDYSNTLAAGKYGCKFGIVADTEEFGRFHPASFVLTAPTFANRMDITGCHIQTTGTIAASSTTLTVASATGLAVGDTLVVRGAGPVGTDLLAAITAIVGNTVSLATAAGAGGAGAAVYRQGFTYQNEPMALGFTVTAMNGAASPEVTQNYAGDWASGTIALQAENSNSGISLGARLQPNVTASWSNGAYTLTEDKLLFVRDTTPDGPYDNLQIGVAVSDLDGVVLLGRNMNPATTGDCIAAGNCTGVGVANTRIRFGRLKLSNAHGSELLNLPVPAETQYWNGAVFITNTADSCTTLAASSVGLTKAPLTCTTALLGNAAFAAGRSSLVLSRPNAVCRADLVVNLDAAAEKKAYLQGKWNGTGFNQNPRARATFGIYKGGPVIYVREMY